MKTLLSVFIVTSAWFAAEARACDVPALVVIPDGTRVSAQQLNDVRADIYQYLAAMDAYLACLEEEMEAAGGRDRVPPDYMTLMINRHNIAVDEMATVLQHFNAQVQAYTTSNDTADSTSSGQSDPGSDDQVTGGGDSASDTTSATGAAQIPSDAD